MGAGKGKARRGQVTVSSGEAIFAMDMNKWQDFVSGSGLEGVTLREYYVEDFTVNALGISPGAYTKIIAEIFADAVAIGAIVLPKPYKADDFEFRHILLGQYAVHLKGRPGEEEKFATLVNANSALPDGLRCVEQITGAVILAIKKLI